MPLETTIPFNRPFIVGKELFYISQAVLGGKLAANGSFTRLCEQWMEEEFGARRVLLTHSCTAALEMAAILADIGPGDEVVMPSYTFVSTANAFVLRGARIRFVDIRPDSLNIDENLVAAAITDETRAIVPVHYAGVACEMERIGDIAAKRDLLVIEDAAQGVNATYRDRFLGTIGDLGTYSFHETKNFISGEGGALVINNERFLERAELVRDKGTDRGRFFRGEVDKYSWVDIGSSFAPSELVAAFLYAQLEAADVITEKRRTIFRYFGERFAPCQDRGLLRMPVSPAECRHNAHMFYLIVASREVRDGLLRHLRQHGIHAVFHYVPLHESPMGRRMGYSRGDLPVTEDLSDRLLRIPCYFELEQEQQDRIVDAVVPYLERAG